MGLRKKKLSKIRILTRFGSKHHIIDRNKKLKGDSEILLLTDFTCKLVITKPKPNRLKTTIQETSPTSHT